nr:hypothetical protein [Tanacetum cinerariifolium]
MLKGVYFGAKTMIFEDCLILPNTSYPQQEIRRINANSSLENVYKQFLIWRITLLLDVDDYSNITMEEYIRLEEEKAQKHGNVFNWETAKYGKIWYDEDVYDLRSVETEFPIIVFNDNLTSNEMLSCKPMGKLVSKNGYGVLDMALSSRDQRHQYLRTKTCSNVSTIVREYVMEPTGTATPLPLDTTNTATVAAIAAMAAAFPAAAAAVVGLWLAAQPPPPRWG